MAAVFRYAEGCRQGTPTRVPRWGPRQFVLCLFSAFVVALVPHAAAAQVDTGVVQGTIRDSSGGVVPGATVTLTNVNQNTSFQTVTNSEGNYQFPAVRVGTYTVAAELPGFTTGRREAVEPNIQQRFVADFVLKPSTLAETVEVTSQAAPLQTQEVSMGGVVVDKLAAEFRNAK